MKQERLYTVREATEIFGMSQSFYRTAIRLKQLEFVKVKSAVRLTENSIKKFLDSQSTVVEVAQKTKGGIPGSLWLDPGNS